MRNIMYRVVKFSVILPPPRIHTHSHTRPPVTLLVHHSAFFVCFACFHHVLASFPPYDSESTLHMISHATTTTAADSETTSHMASHATTATAAELPGTPMQNELTEFYNMVNFCNPLVLGTHADFKRRYST